VFSQETAFRLVSDHLRQEGPSFPNSLEVNFNAASGDVKVTSTKDGVQKIEQHHLQMPEDVANGLVLTPLKNRASS
jgi:hypothetical protein